VKTLLAGGKFEDFDTLWCYRLVKFHEVPHIVVGQLLLGAHGIKRVYSTILYENMSRDLCAEILSIFLLRLSGLSCFLDMPKSKFHAESQLSAIYMFVKKRHF
jgi:hypothetical protein